jgi:hypothetical protein
MCEAIGLIPSTKNKPPKTEKTPITSFLYIQLEFMQIEASLYLFIPFWGLESSTEVLIQGLVLAR